MTGAIDTALYVELEPTVVAAARRWFRRFHKYTTLADVQQECWVWVIRHNRRVLKWKEEDEEGFLRTLDRRLGDVAHGFCQTEKAAFLGYRVSDLYFYSVETLKDLLPSIYDYELWLPGQVVEDRQGPRRQRALAEGNERVATLSDVARGVRQLSDDDQALLWERYGQDQSVDDMADRREIPAPTMRKQLDRAVRRLHRQLGGERPTFEGRRAMSNSAAQHAVRDI